MKKVVIGLVTVMASVAMVFGMGAQPVLAKTCGDGQVETSILGGGGCVDANADQIQNFLFLIVRILVYGLGAAAVIGVVIAGILYLTARDNEQQAVVAKRRLFEIAIGLVAWALVFVVVEWLIPGGLGEAWDKVK